MLMMKACMHTLVLTNQPVQHDQGITRHATAALSPLRTCISQRFAGLQVTENQTYRGVNTKGCICYTCHEVRLISLVQWLGAVEASCFRPFLQGWEPVDAAQGIWPVKPRCEANSIIPLVRKNKELPISF